MLFPFKSFSLLAFALFFTAVASADETDMPKEMTFCYENQDYLPFIRHVSGDLVSEGKNGVLPDLVLQATKKLGIKANFVSKPWKRCIVLLQAGEVDGIFAAIWQPERDKWGVFPKIKKQLNDRYKIWQVNYQVYSRKDSALEWDGQVFTGVVTGISAPLGYVAESKLHQQGVKSRTSYLPADGLHLVAKHRLDGYVLESSIGDYLIRSEGLDTDVQPLPIPFFSADWYLPLSHRIAKKYPQAPERFWRALAEVREANGETLKTLYQQD